MQIPGIKYHFVGIDDDDVENVKCHFEAAAEFILSAKSLVQKLEKTIFTPFRYIVISLSLPIFRAAKCSSFVRVESPDPQPSASCRWCVFTLHHKVKLCIVKK